MPQVFLAKGDTVVPITKGDMLDGVYRVDAIGPTQITLVYLPLNQVQTIPVFGVLAAQDAGEQPFAAPAQVLVPPSGRFAAGSATPSSASFVTPVPAIVLPPGPAAQRPSTATFVAPVPAIVLP